MKSFVYFFNHTHTQIFYFITFLRCNAKFFLCHIIYNFTNYDNRDFNVFSIATFFYIILSYTD